MVIALIGVLAAFAWPNFAGAEKSEQLRESARRVQSLVAMCRAEAMNDARRYRIRVRTDGSLRVEQQVDPLEAPHVYARVRSSWSQTAVLLSSVWVEAVQPLPDGPPPLLIVDEKLKLPEMEIKPALLAEFEETPDDLCINFEPDGSCNSVRWVLRDERGLGLLVTLDGRLGRVTTEEWEAVDAEDVERPPAVEEEEEEVEGVA